MHFIVWKLHFILEFEIHYNCHKTVMQCLYNINVETSIWENFQIKLTERILKQEYIFIQLIFSVHFSERQTNWDKNQNTFVWDVCQRKGQYQNLKRVLNTNTAGKYGTTKIKPVCFLCVHLIVNKFFF